MLKPNYFVIGAAKAASSSICTLLGDHPDAFMVDCKEPCFFNKDEHFLARGWEWYDSLYLGSEACRRRGEGSNQYTMKEFWPHTAQRIFNSVPEAKLIYVVRDPLSRIESLWMQMRANGDKNAHPDFNRAIAENPKFLVDSTNYLRQLVPYQALFPDTQIKTVFYEDFKSNPASVMRELFQYLQIDPAFADGQTMLHANPSEGKAVFTPTLIHMRRSKLLWPLKRLFSDRSKQWLAEKFFKKPMRKRPVWSDNSRQFALERIGEDCVELLREHGRPASFWPSLNQR